MRVARRTVKWILARARTREKEIGGAPARLSVIICHLNARYRAATGVNSLRMLVYNKHLPRGRRNGRKSRRRRLERAKRPTRFLIARETNALEGGTPDANWFYGPSDVTTVTFVPSVRSVIIPGQEEAAGEGGTCRTIDTPGLLAVFP